jgi:hypothetical protein
MTSRFEGVPYVVYEAMAMGLPVVAPALSGNVELVTEATGVLVDPGADKCAYARAVTGLMDDPARATELGKAGRSRTLEHFSVRSMAGRHAQLYEDLLEVRRAKVDQRAVEAVRASLPPFTQTPPRMSVESGIPSSLRLSTRPSSGHPLVSVVVPCFNHGHVLPACIDSIVDQDYDAIEVIVVDDASTDLATVSTLGAIEARDRVRVIRQRRNAGPSAARNRAIKEAEGRYVLPVDADNILLPGAIAGLVEQIQAAGELVGYIYPNCQYFGTRDDYFQPPAFNLAVLLLGNYCDTCSLIDREVFDAGLIYPEEIKLGHEDWDYVLTLAAHGIRGEPAHAKTLLYRKHGFTRSDTVEYGRTSFHEEVPRRHPELYGGRATTGRFGRWRGPAADIKARYAPGLSIVMTSGVDFLVDSGEGLLRRLEAQTCRDFELIAECVVPRHLSGHPVIMRIPPGLCADSVELLREGLSLARARRVLLAGEELSEMLAEPGFIERLMRTFWARPRLEAIAFTNAGGEGMFPHRLLDDQGVHRNAHSLAWRREAESKLPGPLLVRGGLEAESIARAMSVNGVELQWRHADDYATRGDGRVDVEGWVDLLQHKSDTNPHRRVERKMVADLEPAVPSLPSDGVRRWLQQVSWIPPGTDILTRHRELDSERRTIKLGRTSPPGYVLEFDLGAIQLFAPPGTVRLVEGTAGIHTVPRGSPRSGKETELGHLELAPLPLFQAVERATLPDGSETLVAGDHDMLRAEAIRLEFLGFIEAFPNLPTLPPDARRALHGVVGLLRCIDRTARHHVYRVGSADGDELISELGALHLTAEPGSIAVSIDQDGLVFTEQYVEGVPSADIAPMLRWAVAPLAWTGFGHVRGRVRSVARRGLETVERVRLRQAGGSSLASSELRQRTGGPRAVVGYLHRAPGRGRKELFAATHPITGDQLLTHHPLEASDMGYGPALSLGYILEQAPVTGTLAVPRVTIPWASRFGLKVRQS